MNTTLKLWYNIIVYACSCFIGLMGKSVGFSQEFLRMGMHKNMHNTPLYQNNRFEWQQSHYNSWDSGNSITTFINSATALYAAIKIYTRYTHMHGNNSTQSSLVKKMLVMLSPQLVNINALGMFFLDSVGIVCQALLYKTVVKLIVFCATGDLVDAAGIVVRKGKKWIAGGVCNEEKK